MDSVHVERLDHFGLIAHVIKDLGLIRRLDARLVPDAQEEITPGDAVAGMILHGLGLATRPLSLTPQFFANTPLDLRWRDGVQAEMCQRFTLGRTLAEVHASGCDLWLSDLASTVCVQASMAQRCHHLDTTRLALSGDSSPESDEQAMRITPGYAKDHRPALQQAVLERMVSPDGGVPLVSQSWDGQVSATQMFQERAAALRSALASAPTPRYRVAEATWSTADHAATLATRGFMTRMPGPLKLVSQVLSPALQRDTGHASDDTPCSQGLALGHDGMPPRWRVISSHAARERAEASVTKAPQRAGEALEQPRGHWPATRFERPAAAHAALAARARAWRSHQVDTASVIAHQHSAGTGRPTPARPLKSIAWQLHAPVRPAHEQRATRKQPSACFVIGTNLAAHPWSAVEVRRAYTAQGQVAGGCRWLKAPLFFGSSLFVKQPCRMQGLLRVMT